MASTMTFKDWRKEVERLFVASYGADWNDLCGDNAPLQAAFDAGDTPQVFVDWYADKYDLIKFK